MQRILSIALTGLVVTVPMSALADKGNDWRAEYEAMTNEEKSEFNKTRAEIKSKVNQMSNEEREAFKKQIESQHGSAAGETIYIEAIPQDNEMVRSAPEKNNEKKATGWQALSFEEKRQMYLDDKK